jgi:predicted  nucleic acid-binding Zn-ribbon protein
MVPTWLQKLLILQDRDQRCDNIERQLASIPDDIRKEEAEIGKLQSRLREQESEWKHKEAERLELEGEVGDAEAAVVKYKTQQMQVKKNEEYQALESEIAALQEKIGALEDRELALLEELDHRQTQLEKAREEIGNQIRTLETHIERLHRNRESFAADLEEAKKAVADCEPEIDDSVLRQYRYVKQQVKRPPVVVALEEGRCKGCHLKVSGDVESMARKGRELVRCDSCGRILYYDR